MKTTVETKNSGGRTIGVGVLVSRYAQKASFLDITTRLSLSSSLGSESVIAVHCPLRHCSEKPKTLGSRVWRTHAALQRFLVAARGSFLS